MAAVVSKAWGRFAAKRGRGSFGLDVPVERKGRFGVVKKDHRTIDGRVFDSGKEAVRFAELKNAQRAGLIECLECQPSWDVFLNGSKLCSYSADFSYIDTASGRPVIEDVKSSGTVADAAYRLRKRAAELAHGIKITEVTSR